MGARLVITSGQMGGVSIALHQEEALVLGRHPKCKLHFADDSISSHHCRIFSEDEDYYVEDLGSTNGTYLNNKKISSPCKLSHNDLIGMGTIQLCFMHGKQQESDLPKRPRISTTVMEPMDYGEEKRIGDYAILKKIGTGGTSEIFKCRHIVSGQIVALKILHAQSLSEVTLQRFLSEVETCMRFDHPSIIKVIDFGIYHNQPVLATEYSDGISLEEHVRKFGPLPVENALKIAAQTTQGLHYAHKRGVVHRDLNPSNILINDRQEIKIIDFGIAKVYGKSITISCETLGTVRYIPPEQIDDARNVDHRADIYALGTTLYHLLSGKPPYFDVHGLNALVMKITEGAAASLHKVTKVPESVASLVAKAMSPKKEERYQTALEFFQAIMNELNFIIIPHL
jgi:serine/threonine protein kinase